MYECLIFIPGEIGSKKFVEYFSTELSIFSGALFSCDETEFPEKNILSDKSSFDAFTEKYGDDLFLRTVDGHIFNFFKKSDVIICSGTFEEEPDIDNIREFLGASIEFGCEFGIYCEYEEYLHRNRISLKPGSMDLESWVGRDISSYLPGLYFITATSTDLLIAFGATEGHLQLFSDALVVKTGRVRVFQFFPDSASWRQNAERLDQVCASVPWIFSKTHVLNSLEGVHTLKEARTELRRWR